MNDNWTDCDLKVFEKCKDSMTYHDFLFTDNMDTKIAMNSTPIGLPKLDAHVLANGIFGVSDFIKANPDLPNESVSHDQIRKIIGYLFDCQVSRFQGYSLYQSFLTSAYVHREFEIKNHILETLIKSFVAATDKVEKFMAAAEFRSVIWINDNIEADLYHDYDIDKLRTDLQSLKNKESDLADVFELALFELDFAEYIEDIYTKKCPSLPPVHEESESIGFSNFMHYRDLPTTCPPSVPQIPEHKKAIQIMKEMIETIQAFENYPKDTSFRAFLDTAFNWGISHIDTISLPRFILYYLIFPPGANILDQTADDFVKKDFEMNHIPQKFFDGEDSSEFPSHVLSFACPAIRAFIMPPCCGYGYAEQTLIKLWGMIQNFVYSMQHSNLKPSMFPRTTNDSYNKIVCEPASLWVNEIAFDVALDFFKLGFLSDIYNNDDYSFIFHALHVIFKAKAQHVQPKNIINAVHKLADPKGKKKRGPIKGPDVQREIGREIPEELEYTAIADFFDGCFHMMRFCHKVDAMKFKKTQFYNRTNAYGSRISPISHLNGINILPPEGFSIMFDITNITPAKLKNDAIRKWNEAKDHISKSVQARGGEKSPLGTSLLRSTVMSSINLGKWKEGNTISISFNEIFPTFVVQ